MDTVDPLLDSLRRAVAVPGTFETIFPDTNEDGLKGSLLDGAAEAQLDGFLSDLSWDADPESPTWGELDPDITQAQGALLVLYSSKRFIETELQNRKNHVKYEASGGLAFEQDYSAQVMTQRLKEISERIKEVRTRADTAGAGAAFEMADMYLGVALESTSWTAGPFVLPDLG